MIARWYTNVRMWLVWLLAFSLALVILALFHELLVVFIVNTLQWGRYLARFLSMLYYVLAGLVCIAFFIFIYPYLERSVKKGRLFQKAMRVVGIQLLLIGLIQLGLMVYFYLPASGENLLLVFGEAVAAAILFVLSSRTRKLISQ
jgi:hypothetical protein